MIRILHLFGTLPNMEHWTRAGVHTGSAETKTIKQAMHAPSQRRIMLDLGENGAIALHCAVVKNFDDAERLRGHRFEVVMVDDSFHRVPYDQRTNVDTDTLLFTIRTMCVRP